MLALIAAAVLLAPLALPLSRASADAAQVTVVRPGGEERQLALEALAGHEDVSARPYLLRGPEGESSVTVTGFSLEAIVAAAADPYGFTYLEVQRPGGGSVVLSRHQAFGGGFPEGPPVVYATPTGTAFLRPTSGPQDLNASDSFETPQGLRIVLRKGVQLRVRATATPLRVKPGEKVRFSAVVEGAGAGEAVDLSWSFDDGNRVAGEKVTHSFAKPGSYDVVVGASTAGNRTGSSDVVTIQVGEPAGGGPDRKGGGTNKRDDAPDHGAASGPGSGAPSVPPATSLPSPAPVSPPVPTTTTPPEQTRPKPPAQPQGEAVAGTLLEAGMAAAPEAQPEADAAQPPQPVARTGTPGGSGGGGLPQAAVGVLVTAGLLAAGGLVEARNLLR